LSAATLGTLSKVRVAEVVTLFQGMRVTRTLSNFVRVMGTTYATINPLKPAYGPLSFGDGPSRFSPVHPITGAKPTFGLIYGAADLASASYEAIVRARFDLNKSRILMPVDYRTRSAVNFSSSQGQTLNLLDMTRGQAIRAGVPTDVIRYSNHNAGQHYSEFVYKHMKNIDGFLYDSRFTEILCVAVYDRALSKLIASPLPLPLTQSILTPTMASWNISVQ